MKPILNTTKTTKDDNAICYFFFLIKSSKQSTNIPVLRLKPIIAARGRLN